MPCRDFLSQLREAHPRIEALGARVVAVATGAPFQARDLVEREGMPFPCLLDPDKHLYRALGIQRIRGRQWVRPSTWRRYLRSVRRARPGALTGDVLQAPGAAVIEPGGTLRYLHRGVTLGDYPPLGDVLAVVEDAASGR